MKNIRLSIALYFFVFLCPFFSLKAQCPPVTGLEICGVSADTSGTHMIVTWDKTNFAQVDTFLIQREMTPGTYATIGKVPYDSLSWFHDYGANPAVDTFRYKMGIIDTCGMRFDTITLFHQPVFVSQPYPGYFDYTFYWIEKDTIPQVSWYALYRDSLSNGVWDSISLMVPTQNIIFDNGCFNNPANYQQARWRLEIIWNRICTPTLKLANSGQSQSMTQKILSNTNSTHFTGIKDRDQENLIVFPNPAKQALTIAGLKENSDKEIKIFDLLGNEVLRVVVTIPRTTIDVSKLTSGLYFIQSGSIRKSFVKE